VFFFVERHRGRDKERLRPYISGISR
jgi:hypothetical protein